MSTSPALGQEEANTAEIEYPVVSAAAQKAGRITIVGFGSLLSIRSAECTFPDLSGFRLGVIRGFRRVFAHVAPIFIERGIARLETKEMSSVSVEPTGNEKDTLLVSVFEIPLRDLPAFYAREMEFRWLLVPVYTGTGDTYCPLAINKEGMLCAMYTDEEYRRDRLKNCPKLYQEAYGRFGIEKIWRADLLPCPVYLRHVVLAAAHLDVRSGTQHKNPRKLLQWRRVRKTSSSSSEAEDQSKKVTLFYGGECEFEEITLPENGHHPTAAVTHSTPADARSSAAGSDNSMLTHADADLVSVPGGAVLDSLLDSSFLGDRKTTIREYVTKRRPDIMLVQPPQEFRMRYNG
jgi:hypothetical protein